MAGWSIPTELVSDVRQQALDELMELGPELVGALLGTDGSAPGDQSLTRGQRILQFIDDSNTGALDILRVQSTWRFNERVKQFQEDIAASPLGGA